MWSIHADLLIIIIIIFNGSACVEASSHHLWFICYLVDVGQRLFVLDQHLGELQALVWIDTHHVSQQKHPVWGVAHL